MFNTRSPGLGRVDGWRRRRPTEPLGWTVRFIGTLIAAAIAAGLLLSVTGHGSWSAGGFGHASICATEPRLEVGGSDSTLPGDPQFAAAPGATVSVAGAIQACAQHPSAGQRMLYSLTSLPDAVLWLGVLFLLWRLVRTAERHGPFTLPMARLLRFIGWFIIVGSIVAGAAQGAATDALLNTMLQAQNSYGDTFPSLGGLVIPVLAGIVALTFARIVRVGARMEEDLQGTV